MAVVPKALQKALLGCKLRTQYIQGGVLGYHGTRKHGATVEWRMVSAEGQNVQSLKKTVTKSRSDV